MFKKVFKPKIILVFMAGAILSVLFVNFTVFAQSEVSGCSGAITGLTYSSNANAGQTSFDAHLNARGLEGKSEDRVDLSILGIPDRGYAPAGYEYAACVEECDSDTAECAPEYSHLLKGWAWNDNLGFISLHCPAEFDARNDAGMGTGVSCGGQPYGVYFEDPDGDGNGVLKGYAWSPYFGWIQFNGAAADGSFNYGVSRASNGDLSGFAWTEIRLYINFQNAKMFLPGEEVTEDPEDEDWDGNCEDAPYASVCVEPRPSDLGFLSIGVGGAGDARIADGVDGYRVHLYLHNGDGTPINPALYGGPNLAAFKVGITLNWGDTVKLNQLSGEPAVENITNQSPWSAGTGGITYKPAGFTDFVSAGDASDTGHYISRNLVSSYAPTSESNLSYTSGTRPAYTIRNERPLYDSDINIEPNQLILENITFRIPLRLVSGETVFGAVPVYPNGRVGMSLKFRPALEIKELYVNDHEDQIQGYRSIPENVHIKAANYATNSTVATALRNSATVNFELGYNDTRTSILCGDTEEGSDVFDYNFVNGNPPTDTLDYSFGQLTGGENVQIKASLGSELPCDFAQAPYIKSKISYVLDGKTVSYLGNHLPRVADTAISNPTVVIHGTVLTQVAGQVQAGRAVDTSGYVNVNIVRDTINENLQKYLGEASPFDGGECQITALRSIYTDVAVDDFEGGSCSGYYKTFKVGNEKVIYFNGSDVTINLGTLNGEWIVIADEGNIFIDKDIYGFASGAKISLVAFRAEGDDFYNTGHVYIAPCLEGEEVKNIQAIIVADGTLFSYPGDHDEINDNGEPEWDDYNEMINSLSCQLKMDAAIYSDNTIGGADLDSGNNPKNYLLLGGGESLMLNDQVTTEDRMRAQQYDLNYLRMFRLGIETSEDGLPIDQKCQKALTPADVMNIALWKVDPVHHAHVIGEDEEGNEVECDGINPLKRYSPATGVGSGSSANEGPDGDLVPPTEPDILAHGLDNTADFDPVYIFYMAPSKDSFLFSKKGALKAGN